MLADQSFGFYFSRDFDLIFFTWEYRGITFPSQPTLYNSLSNYSVSWNRSSTLQLKVFEILSAKTVEGT